MKWFLLLSVVILQSCASSQVGDKIIRNREEILGKTPFEVQQIYGPPLFAGWFRAEKLDYILAYEKEGVVLNANPEEAACIEIHFEKEDRYLHMGWVSERICSDLHRKSQDDSLVKGSK